MIFDKNTTIVLTGEPTQCDRIEFMEIMETFGCAISGSVSRRTTCLVCGENAQQKKIDRAKELGIPILSELEFWEEFRKAFPPRE